MTKETNNNPLDDFNWDNQIDFGDAFSDLEPTDDNGDDNDLDLNPIIGEEEEDNEDNQNDETDDDTQEEEEPVEDDTKKKSNKKTTKTTKKEEKLEEFDFNGGKGSKESKKVETTIYDDVYKDLKEYGILKHVNIEENEKLTPERLEELYQQDYETEVTNRINDWANKSLDEDAQAFVKFKLNGGKTKDFLNVYLKESELPEGNIEDEDFQDEVIRYQLRQEDYDHDEIEDMLENLTNSGRKKQRAEKYYKRIEANLNKEKEQVLLRQEQERKLAIEKENKYTEDVKKILTESKDLGGLKVTDKEKVDLFNFLTKRSVKVNDSYSVTGFQKKLADTINDKGKLVLLAKLLHSDFNFDSLKKQVETATTRKVRSNLENRKGLEISGVGSSTNKGINLSEIFSGI